MVGHVMRMYPGLRDPSLYLCERNIVLSTLRYQQRKQLGEIFKFYIPGSYCETTWVLFENEKQWIERCMKMATSVEVQWKGGSVWDVVCREKRWDHVLMNFHRARGISISSGKVRDSLDCHKLDGFYGLHPTQFLFEYYNKHRPP
eukprot:162784-Rhodomonas_salina.1